jgi:hypothetical protein
LKRKYLEKLLTWVGPICIIGDCLLFFLPAREYLLFDNSMNQARTRLVFGFWAGAARLQHKS